MWMKPWAAGRRPGGISDGSMGSCEQCGRSEPTSQALCACLLGALCACVAVTRGPRGGALDRAGGVSLFMVALTLCLSQIPCCFYSIYMEAHNGIWAPVPHQQSPNITTLTPVPSP